MAMDMERFMILFSKAVGLIRPRKKNNDTTNAKDAHVTTNFVMRNYICIPQNTMSKYNISIPMS